MNDTPTHSADADRDRVRPEGDELSRATSEAPSDSPAENVMLPEGTSTRELLIEMFKIAGPTIAIMTSYTVMQFFDGLMVSHIAPADPANFAAQGNGGMAAWLSMSLMMGIVTVINTFVSQNLGAGKAERGSAYAWTGLWMTLAYWVCMLPLVLALPWLFRIMKHEGNLLNSEIVYAQILIVGAIFTLGGRTISQFFFGIHKPVVVLVGVLIANLLNLHLNMLLIFGSDGLPETSSVFVNNYAIEISNIASSLGIDAMGIKGAAFATVTASAVEFAIPMLIFLSPWMHKKYQTRTQWRLDVRAAKDTLRIGWPGGLMFISEMFCWMYLMAYLLGSAGAAAGDDPDVHNAAGWIALRYMHMSFMPTVGLSIAITAMVGRCMGMRRPDLAAQRAWLGLKIALIYMGLCALVFVLWRTELVMLFVPDTMNAAQIEKLVEVGSVVMITAAIFQLFDAIAIILSGALRGAGDTVWPGIMTIVLCWTCIPIGGWLFITFAPGLGSIGPWIAGSAYIILLGIGLLVRFVHGKWKHISLVDDADNSSHVPL